MWIDCLPETARVDDAVMARAYEATGNEGRAWLKTTMALSRALHGEAPEARTEYLRPAGAGFDIVRYQRPADWVLAVVGQNFAAAARLTAALMTARLAGVPRVVALLVGDAERIAPPVLAALELLGVEDVFQADADLLSTVTETAGADSGGRVLTFGHAFGNTFGHTFEHSLGTSLPESFRPRVWVDTPPCAVFAPDTEADAALHVQVHRTHPDMVLLQHATAGIKGSETASVPVDSAADVSYTNSIPLIFSGQGTEQATPALVLSPELAGAWACPELIPAFFTVTQLVSVSTATGPQFFNRS